MMRETYKRIVIAVAFGFSLGCAAALAPPAFAQDDPPLGPEDTTEEAAEEAEHEEGHHMTLGSVLSLNNYAFWGSVVNFLCFALFVTLLAEKPLSGFLTSRRSAIEEGLAEAKRLKEQAEATRTEYERRLSQLDVELAQIKNEMIAAGESERDRIVAEAEAKAVRMRKDAEFVIEQHIKQLRIDLSREAAEAAVEAARTVLVESTMPSDQHRLAQDYLERLKTKRAAS